MLTGTLVVNADSIVALMLDPAIEVVGALVEKDPETGSVEVSPPAVVVFRPDE